MDIATNFNAPTAKGRPKVIKIRDGTEVAARLGVLRVQAVRGYWADIRCSGAALYGTGDVSGDHFPSGRARMGHSPGCEGQAGWNVRGR